MNRLLGRAVQRAMRPFNRYWHTDHTWEGRLLELTGNHARIDGVLIDVSAPVIATRDKASLFKRTYEIPERNLIGMLPRNLPLIELGGSIGVLACITNHRLNDPVRHVVVEANPDLIPILTRNRDLNGCRFQIVNAAVAYGSDEVQFYQQDKFLAGSLNPSSGPSIRVPVRSLQSLADTVGFNHFVLVCDIEGAEIAMIENEADVLAQRVNWLLLERHEKIVGADVVRAMESKLHNCGFEIIRVQNRVTCYQNTKR